MVKPDTELSSRIVQRLRNAGLLSEGILGKVEAGLSTGTMSPEDWKLVVELEMSGKKGATPIEDK